ncbi:MAG: DUF5799 family protein [Halobacteriota archaeon]
MADWTDAVVGERLAVDNEFNKRLSDSMFSRQEWGLIMTVTSFEIENADDPEAARIVANTENVPYIMSDLEKIRSTPGPMGPAGDSGSSSSKKGGGFLGNLMSALGLGGGEPDYSEEISAAERLTQEYAEELQAHLEANDKWEQVRIAYNE